MKRILLFKKCLGLNDARTFGTQTMKVDGRDPEAGSTELVACSDLSVTDDGCLQKIPSLTTEVTHSGNIAHLSATEVIGSSSGGRLIVQDVADSYELVGTSLVKRFPLVIGPVCHTLLDVRVATASKVYKSKNATPTMAEATVGTNPGPATSVAFGAMPVYKQAFIHNAKLYAVNAADARFLQYSEDYHYDLWNVGDGFIGSKSAILQAGSIPGVLVTTHADGVTVYVGTGPQDFRKQFYPCKPFNNTLFSGQASMDAGYVHLFVADNGLFAVTPAGELVRVASNFEHRNINSSYTCCAAAQGKYLAFGNLVCLEFDTKNNIVLTRQCGGVVSACNWNGVARFAVGKNILKSSGNIDTSESACSLTLPYSDWGHHGRKSIDSFYFTGEMPGVVTFTVTDQTGLRTWSVTTDDVGKVSNYRIKTPKGMLGNHISLCISATGAFRMEELSVVVAGSKRSR